MTPLATKLSDALASDLVTDWMENVQLYAPGIKHENFLSTAIACALGTAGIPTVREARTRKAKRAHGKTQTRRFDLKIGESQYVEIKYHLECDVPDIDRAIKQAPKLIANFESENKPSSWDAGAAFLQELWRMEGTAFLWAISIRPLGTDCSQLCMGSKAAKYWKAKGQPSMQKMCDDIQSELIVLCDSAMRYFSKAKYYPLTTHNLSSSRVLYFLFESTNGS